MHARTNHTTHFSSLLLLYHILASNFCTLACTPLPMCPYAYYYHDEYCTNRYPFEYPIFLSTHLLDLSSNVPYLPILSFLILFRSLYLQVISNNNSSVSFHIIFLLPFRCTTQGQRGEMASTNVLQNQVVLVV